MAAPDSVRDFYDGLAGEYHLVYGDSWDAAVERQGAALDRLIRDAHGARAQDVLDCSCGIGTQAIGLAGRGHRVVGSDISEVSVERARREAARFGVEVAFAVADFRDLASIQGPFHVVISCDNALPHLLDDAEIATALRAMRSKLTAGGLLVIGVRDYGRALVERPALSPAPAVIAGPPRRLVVRYHDWDDDGPCYTVHIFVLTEGEAGWATSHHSTRYRAIARDALARLVAGSGFAGVAWLEAGDAGFHQPLLLARAV
jgi:SAM-dependent methyltransferase